MKSTSGTMAFRTAVSFLAALFFFASGAWARPTTEDEARNAAINWLSLELKPMGSPLGHEVKKVETFSDEYGDPAYYVVHLAPSGLIFLPADDLVEPIIGFLSGATSYDPSPSNPLGALTSRDIPGRVVHFRQQEAALAKGETPAAGSAMAKAQKKWAMLLGAGVDGEGSAPGGGSGPPSSVSDVRVAPFVQSEWSQSTACTPSLAVWNYYTPPGSPGDPNNYVCGCGPTAVAQIMRYLQYPTAGIGVRSLSYSVQGSESTGQTRGGDDKGGPYVWNNMPPQIDCNTITQDQRQEIGRLIWDVALAMGENFGPSGSGSGAPEWALLNVFQFSNAIGGNNFPNNIPEPNIWQMINPNLHAGLPVVVGISGPPGAHAVVCDGYGYNWSTIYHHINMGWAGASDGWYNLPTIASFDVVNGCDYNFYTSGKGEIIAGRVTDWKGNPLSGANVQLTTTGKPPIAIATATDAQGLFAFTHVGSDSTYNITVTAKGHTFPQFSATTGTSASGTIDVGNVWMQDLAETIPPHQTLVSVTSSEDPSNYGDAVTFTATVAGSGATPTGTVQFWSGPVHHQVRLGKPVTLSGGSASISTSSLPPGSIPIMAAYSGDKNYNQNKGYLPDGQTVNKLSSTTTVSSSANPASQGQSITFTATVSGPAGTPTGQVQFKVDNTNFGSPVNLTNGSATSKATSTLSDGAHTVTASYSGDPYFLSSSGTLAGGQLVWQGSVATTTTVASSANPSPYGQSVTFTATVTGKGGTPTGTVLFLDGSASIGTRTLSGGSTTLSTSTLPIGKHTINANYSGDNTFWPSSGNLTQTITQALPATQTNVVSSLNPSIYGQSVTFTATVTGTGGTPTGTVTFLDGTSTIGTGTLSGGSTSIQTSSLSAGNHTITANYSGDSNFASSTGTLTGGQTVKQASSTTTVLSSSNPAPMGSTVTFTATVTGTGGTPSGTVQFVADQGTAQQTVIGSATLSGGSASVQSSSLSVGNHTITANYNGDSNFASSTGTLPGEQTILGI
jgi:hypothetical protein